MNIVTFSKAREPVLRPNRDDVSCDFELPRCSASSDDCAGELLNCLFRTERIRWMCAWLFRTPESVAPLPPGAPLHLYTVRRSSSGLRTVLALPMFLCGASVVSLSTDVRCRARENGPGQHGHRRVSVVCGCARS